MNPTDLINQILQRNPELAFIALLVVVATGGIILYLLIDRLLEYMQYRKIVKHPEYIKAIAEREEKRAKIRFTPPNLVPKKVKVLVLREDQILEDVCRTDGETIRCPKLQRMFTIPPDYRPYIHLIGGKKIMVTFMFDEKNNGIKVKINEHGAEAEKIKIDPGFQERIVGKRIFEHVFRRFAGMDWASFIAGIGIGAFALVLIVFFILPLLGYPISIGRQPVEVIVQQPAVNQSILPPPGNFTLGG
jgi:hypothetical protein